MLEDYTEVFGFEGFEELEDQDAAQGLITMFKN